MVSQPRLHSRAKALSAVIDQWATSDSNREATGFEPARFACFHQTPLEEGGGVEPLPFRDTQGFKPCCRPFRGTFQTGEIRVRQVLCTSKCQGHPEMTSIGIEPMGFFIVEVTHLHRFARVPPVGVEPTVPLGHGVTARFPPQGSLAKVTSRVGSEGPTSTTRSTVSPCIRGPLAWVLVKGPLDRAPRQGFEPRRRG